MDLFYCLSNTQQTNIIRYYIVLGAIKGLVYRQPRKTLLAHTIESESSWSMCNSPSKSFIFRSMNSLLGTQCLSLSQCPRNASTWSATTRFCRIKSFTSEADIVTQSARSVSKTRVHRCQGRRFPVLEALPGFSFLLCTLGHSNMQWWERVLQEFGGGAASQQKCKD